MFQSFYDEDNNRFIVSPLRCGSSYTDRFARELGWINVDDLYHDAVKEANLTQRDITLLAHNPVLKLLLIMQDSKYQNSEWITLVRDPWARYVSATTMILGTSYGAPGYVSEDEIKLLSDQPGLYCTDRDSAYYHTDREIMIRNSNSLGFDFTFQDTHCIPVLTVQLMLYVLNKNLKLVKLVDYTAWLKKHYPAGDKLQPDFYEIVSQSKRSSSDQPTYNGITVYKRFLEPLGWYNEKKARRFNIQTTFSEFIQFDYDCWELIKSDELNRQSAESLLIELMEDPYFYARNKKLYHAFIGAPRMLDIGNHRLFKNIPTIIPEIHQWMVKNTWLNLDFEPGHP